MKNYNLIKLIIFYLSIMSLDIHAQVKVTQASGNWNIPSIWTPTGVPTTANDITINHAVNLNQAIIIGTSLTINAPLIDIGNNALTINSNGIVTVNANTIINGTVDVSKNSVLIVKSGVSLTINDNLIIDNKFSYITIEAGASLNVIGNVTLNSGDIYVAGNFNIIGNFENKGNTSATVNKLGTGKFTTTGSMVTTNGPIYNKANVSCPNNCDADNLCKPFTVTVSTSPTCLNSNANFTANFTGISTNNKTQISYQWSTSSTINGAYTVVNGFKSSISLTASSAYYVKCIVTIDGCPIEGITQVKFSNVNTPVVKDVNLCGPGIASLTPTPIPLSSFKWYDAPIGGTLLYTGATYTINNITATKTYYVSTYIIANGCESAERVAQTVFVNPVPLNIIAYGNSRCRAGSVTLTASGADSTYQWFSQSGTLLFTGQVFNTPSISTTTTYFVGGISKKGCVTPSANRVSVVATVNANCVITWTGAVSNSWNNPLNWDVNQIPTSTDDVIIPSNTANDLLVQSIVNVKKLTIQANANASVSNIGIINILGDLSILGNFSCSGELAFIGSSPQLINGVFPLSKLTINNTTNVTLNNNLTVTKLLKLLNGVLNSNGKLTIDLNTGNIDPSGVGSIAGNITVSKFVNSFKTHYFACPLDGVTCLDLIDDAEVINPSTKLSRLFQLDYITNKWVSINDINSPLIKGVPYSLYFTTPTTLDFTGTYDHAYIQSFSVDNSTSKLYFIPNPYPCSLDWDSPSGWTNKSALNNSISFWDGATSKYITYTTGAGINGATNIIPSMQGYWIRTNGAGGTFPIVIGKGAWKPDETKALWRTVALNDNYSIKIRNTKTNVSDETILRFMNEATVDFDVQYDAIKFLNPSSNPNLYSNKDKTNYAIQSLPLPNIDTIIPLNIKVPTIGDYEISVMNNVFNPNIEVFLYDSVTTQYMPLNQMTTLGFNSTQSTQRIGLVFKISNNNVTTSTNTYNNTNEDYYVYSEYGSSFLVTKKKSTQLMDFTLYTFDGKMVRNYSNVLLNENIPFNLMLEQVNSGVYLLKNNKDNMSLKFIKY